MNNPGEDSPYCCFHPREVIVGICALCLNERLLVLASKQGHQQPKETHHLIPPSRISSKKLSSISIPKVFALSSFLHRLELGQHKPDPDVNTDNDSIPSLDDSFISMKFEDNGRESWDRKGGNLKPLSSSSYWATDEQNDKGGRSMVEHGKPRVTLRWRKRIGQLLQLTRWKRSGKSNVCHVGLATGNKVMEGVKVRKGWIRSLTRRRTTAASTTATATE